MSTAARQVGEETLSPRAYALVRSAYRVIARQGSHRLSLTGPLGAPFTITVDVYVKLTP